MDRDLCYDVHTHVLPALPAPLTVVSLTLPRIRLDAADTFPVPRTIPPEIRGMIDRYFHRDEA